VLANRGFVYQKMKDHTSAIADFDKSIDLNPGYFKVTYCLFNISVIFEKS
jgi:hypothetical protein